MVITRRSVANDRNFEGRLDRFGAGIFAACLPSGRLMTRDIVSAAEKFTRCRRCIRDYVRFRAISSRRSQAQAIAMER